MLGLLNVIQIYIINKILMYVIINYLCETEYIMLNNNFFLFFFINFPEASLFKLPEL